MLDFPPDTVYLLSPHQLSLSCAHHGLRQRAGMVFTTAPLENPESRQT